MGVETRAPTPPWGTYATLRKVDRCSSWFGPLHYLTTAVVKQYFNLAVRGSHRGLNSKLFNFEETFLARPLPERLAAPFPPLRDRVSICWITRFSTLSTLCGINVAFNLRRTHTHVHTLRASRTHTHTHTHTHAHTLREH